MDEDGELAWFPYQEQFRVPDIDMTTSSDEKSPDDFGTMSLEDNEREFSDLPVRRKLSFQYRH